MYHHHFGLTEPAFSISVNPRYLFMSAQHQEAFAHLVYGVKSGGFVLLTGEVGTGKTTMIRHLLAQLPEQTDVAFILNPMAKAPELLANICEELGIATDGAAGNSKLLTDRLQQFLLANHARGRKTILLIDEAQLLSVPVLEQIRLLTNLETTTQKLLQIILVGQPELKTLLARPALRQLSQRITARFHLQAFNREDTQAYILHRLQVAGLGARPNPFSDAQLQTLQQVSGGIARLINVLCERALLGAYAADLAQVSDAVLQEAIREVLGAPEPEPESDLHLTKRPPASRWRLVATGLACAFIGVGAAAWWFATSSVLDSLASLSPLDSLAPKAAAPSEVQVQASSDGALAGTTSLDMAAARPRDPLLATMAFSPAPWMQQLVQLQTQQVADKEYVCSGHWAVLVDDWVCERAQLSTLNELVALNRPMMLTLVGDDKRWRYVLVDAVGGDQVRLRTLGLTDETTVTVNWRDLAPRWTGEVVFVFRKPAFINGTLQPGDRGPAVVWLAQEFAKLDQQPEPLTRDYYTERLRKRVELFQLSHGLFADGLFGVQTLRKLNEVQGRELALVDLNALMLAEEP